MSCNNNNTENAVKSLKPPKGFVGRACIHIPIKIRWPDSVHPTREELEESLPGFRDQHIPQPLTQEVLMDYFQYVLPYNEDETKQHQEQK